MGSSPRIYCRWQSVYRDWWVRNVKLEDLEATPDTNIEVLKDPNSNIQPPVLGLGGR